MKKMHIKLFSFILLITGAFNFVAQNSEINELRIRAAKADKDSAARCYSRIAYLNTQISADSVMYYAKKAIALASKTSPTKGDGMIQIGNSFSMRQKNDSAIVYYKKGLEFFKSINYEKGIAKAEQSFAVVYYNIGDYDHALEKSILALSMYKKVNFSLGVVGADLLISNCYVAKHKTDSGLFYMRSALSEASKNKTDSSKYFQIMTDYGNRLIDQKQYDSTIYYFNKAAGFLERNGNYGGLINLYINYARINTIINGKANPKMIREYALKALHLADKYNIKDNYKLILDYVYESYIYESSNKDSILKYLYKYQAWIDTLNNKDQYNIVKEVQTKFETEKKDLQIKQAGAELNFQEEKNKQKTIIIWLGAAAFIGTLFFLALAFINYRKAKKANTIIQNQNQVLELQKQEVEKQKHIVEEKQNEIIASINYAQRIQSAVLTGEEVWNKISKEHFIIFMPRDIVSGDFYWAHVLSNGRAVFTLADCTGHGVPGGFMSMLGNSFLNELVVENKLFKADEILNRLREKVIAALFQKGQNEQKDGMDMALCVWNKMDNTLEFAGANNALYLVRDKQITEYKGDKMPIGTYLEENQKFSAQKIALMPNDMIYLTTDGFADQFGGDKGKKFKSKQLEALLVEVSTAGVNEQKQVLSASFARWKKQFEQTDDVSLIGIRIS